MQTTIELIDKAKKIKLLIFDVDGVLTDGKLYLGENGDEYKAFDARDGLGLVLMKKAGYHIAIITGRSSNIVSERMQSLGITYVYQGQSDKYQALLNVCKKLEVELSEVSYLGDDLIDLPAMKHVGLAIAVADAHSYVKQHADVVTEHYGGKGAAREVCEFILETQGQLEEILAEFY